MPDLLTIRPEDDGTWWRVTMGGSKGNILDAALIDALVSMFAHARRTPALKAIVLEGAGPHFSYGAGVEEHLPGEVARMLTRFGSLVYALLDSSVVVLGAVRGRCLGGGLELVSLSHRVFAGADATFGQPEIVLGVFPPLASILLPERIGRAHAEDLCLTGRAIGAEDARSMGLVDEVSEGDPADAALAWARAHLSAKSASSLRHAVRAVRAGLVRRLRAELPALERLYLGELMPTADAVEGLQAFLQKRTPVWRHR
ncbi:MAG TPA: enoyl-CoA hydratase/isomerase family protein [Vicinamibacterales bacterium]|nr:enoyl-CoA hydratase/isomerase family protein [Vicinamibacterales bacterium]